MAETMVSEPDPLTGPRIRDAAAAKDVFNELFARDEEARNSRAQVRRAIEGGLPMSPSKLKSLGRSWQANHNFRIAQADIERAHLPYWRLINDNPRYVSVEIHTENPDRADWQATIEGAYDRFVHEDWGVDYFTNYLAVSLDHVTHGIGTLLFEDRESPRWKAINRADILVPSRTLANVSKFYLVALRHTMTVAELYDKVLNTESASTEGWNIECVKESLVQACEVDRTTPSQSNDWEALQTQIRDNDLGMSSKSDVVNLVSVLVQERDGSITRLIIDENGEVDDFLYEKKGFAESMTECLNCIFYEMPLGDRTFHGIKGFGQKNHAHAATMNIGMNRLLDAGTFSGCLNFKSTGSAPPDYPVLNFGPVNVFSQGLDQAQVYPQTKQLMEILQYVGASKSENQSSYALNDKLLADAETATKTRLLAATGAESNQANAALYLWQFSAVFRQQFSRLRANSSDPDAKKFRKRCLDGGVPKEILDKAEISVTAAASAGSSSPWTRDQNFHELMSLIGNPLINEREVLQSYVANKFGANGVKRYINEQTEDITGQQRQAIMENNDMGSGSIVPVIAQDSHVEHIPEHMQPLMGIVTQFKKSGQVNPEASIAAQLLIQHTEAHFQHLKRDASKKSQHDALWSTFTNLANAAGAMFAANRRQQQQMQQQQLQQPQPMSA